MKRLPRITHAGRAAQVAALLCVVAMSPAPAAGQDGSDGLGVRSATDAPAATLATSIARDTVIEISIDRLTRAWEDGNVAESRSIVSGSGTADLSVRAWFDRIGLDIVNASGRIHLRTNPGPRDATDSPAEPGAIEPMLSDIEDAN